ncbi:hypothetical protein WL77_26585 [Burkholderia ubonensis]|nr:hypothetical protein WL77_26585 [Burkholderia ubonensis]KWE78077.1 hypothetical protein WL79_06045 [Burkholderia ubonensis]
MHVLSLIETYFNPYIWMHHLNETIQVLETLFGHVIVWLRCLTAGDIKQHIAQHAPGIPARSLSS